MSLSSVSRPRLYNQFLTPRKYIPGKRRISIYWTWSYPWETQRDPAEMTNRFSTMTEVRNVLWPAYETPEWSAAQLEGAIIGGKCYLAAYAQQLGATGLTFFDDDVIEFFSPHASGKSVMFLTAVGKPARRQVLK